MAHSLFFGGSGRRDVAHTRPAFPKMPTAPSAFLLLGAPQTPGDQPNHPEGSKSLGEGPLRPKEISRHRDTLGQIRVPDNTAYLSATQHLEGSRPISIGRQNDLDWSICCTPHLTGKYGTKPFLGGTGRRVVAHTHPEFPKLPTAPSALPLFGAPQAPGDKPNLSEGSKSLGGGPLRP